MSEEEPNHSDQQADGSWLELDGSALNQSGEAQVVSFTEEKGVYVDSSHAMVRSRAKKGDVEAQFELCMRYHLGQGGVEQDNEASYRWCYEAAKQGHVWALTNLGWMYEAGAGTERDDAKAANAYRLAAEKGLPEAMVWFGQVLEQGRGVEENPTAAFDWYSRAAEAGDAGGEYNLALCYQFGKGVDKNDDLAFVWYQKASDQQHLEALYNLGWLYSQGRGVTQNAEKAKELFNIAAGHADGAPDELIIEAMDYDQGKGGVDKNPEKSHQLYLQAANKGSIAAMFTVGVNYEYGRGVEKSWQEACRWYKMAANKGHPEASFRCRFRHLVASGEVIRFFRYSGMVGLGGAGMDSGRDPNGVIGQFGRGQGVKKRRRKVKTAKFYLDTDLGERVEVDLPRRPESLYTQQQVTVIYAIRKGRSTGPYMLLVNHQSNDKQTLTTSRAFWDEQVASSNLLIGACFLAAMIGLPLFVGSVLTADHAASTDTMQLVLHPFNWILFIPLVLSFGFWVKFVLSRRSAGIQVLRHQMAEIKGWISHNSAAKKE